MESVNKLKKTIPTTRLWFEFQVLFVDQGLECMLEFYVYHVCLVIMVLVDGMLLAHHVLKAHILLKLVWHPAHYVEWAILLLVVPQCAQYVNLEK